VSLPISELADGAGSALDDQAKLGVPAGSLLSALLTTVILRLRNRHHRDLNG
jgi:NhaA family Na+:H+ antiporter